MGGSGLVIKLYLTLTTLWTVAHQAPLSMGYPRQEYWSGLPFPSPWATWEAPKSTIYFNLKNPLKKTHHHIQNSPGGLVAKNLPSNAGDTGLIPYWGNKIPHGTKQLSQCPTATQPSCSRVRALQLEKPLCTTRERLRAATKIQYSQEIK